MNTIIYLAAVRNVLHSLCATWILWFIRHGLDHPTLSGSLSSSSTGDYALWDRLIPHGLRPPTLFVRREERAHSVLGSESFKAALLPMKQFLPLLLGLPPAAAAAAGLRDVPQSRCSRLVCHFSPCITKRIFYALRLKASHREKPLAN